MIELEEIQFQVIERTGYDPCDKSSRRVYTSAKRVFIHSLIKIKGSHSKYGRMGKSSMEIGEFLGISHVSVLKYAKSELSSSEDLSSDAIASDYNKFVKLRYQERMRAKIEQEAAYVRRDVMDSMLNHARKNLKKKQNANRNNKYKLAL